jgi:hypothetical protein
MGNRGDGVYLYHNVLLSEQALTENRIFACRVLKWSHLIASVNKGSKNT